MVSEGIIAIIAALGGAAGIINIIKAIKTKNRTDEEYMELLQKALDSSELKAEVSKIKEKLEKNDEATACILRHQITSTYETYLKEKKLPSHTKQDICYLYEKYIELGGNSYIKQIYSDMMKWEVIP